MYIEEQTDCAFWQKKTKIPWHTVINCLVIFLAKKASKSISIDEEKRLLVMLLVRPPFVNLKVIVWCKALPNRGKCCWHHTESGVFWVNLPSTPPLTPSPPRIKNSHVSWLWPNTEYPPPQLELLMKDFGTSDLSLPSIPPYHQNWNFSWKGIRIWAYPEYLHPYLHSPLRCGTSPGGLGDSKSEFT